MSLQDAVERRLRENEDVDSKRSDALRRAEELADRYEDIKPIPYRISVERFFGLPAFQSDNK